MNLIKIDDAHVSGASFCIGTILGTYQSDRVTAVNVVNYRQPSIVTLCPFFAPTRPYNVRFEKNSLIYVTQMNLYNLVLRMVDWIISYEIAHVPPYLGIRGTSNCLHLWFFCCNFLYKFVLFECLSVSLKWMLLVIFLCCHTIMPCRTLCHSDLLADCHCLKFHGRFFLFILLAAAGSASPVPPLYLILFALW